MWQIVQGTILTVGSLLIFVAIVYLGNIVFDQTKLDSLALHKKQRFVEFIVFKFSLYALLACWVLLMLLEWWGVPMSILNSVKTVLLSGYNIYGIRIIPMRFLLALMVFAIIQMSWKYTLVYLAKKRKLDPEADTQVVLTSLLSYIVLAVAILIGLSISGVDFTGLAIVAGALSVGIGFGLQNIVNNFVAGIILLLEKTIKPGDRVLIKGYEGFVKKINFRYTRIITLMKEDVLIPNADLITTPIVNYAFDDRIGKVKCFVGVAYDSDLDLVKRTLLNVGLNHPCVLRDPMNTPIVYMNEFGENNLLFELQCVVSDVNKKHTISSDLYMRIATAFKENNITMSYPQREVHISQRV